MTLMKIDFKKAVLILFIFLGATVLTGWFGYILPVSKFQDLIKEGPGWITTNIIDKYPKDLEIKIDKGNVSINKKTPYCLIVNDKDKTGVVFDTDSKGEFSALESGGIYSKLCQPMAVVGKNFVMYKDNNQYKTDKFSEQINYTINRAEIEKFAGQYLPVAVNFGKTIYWIVPIIATGLIGGLLMLVNFWYAFVAKIFIKLFKVRKEIETKEIYSLTLFLYTIILAVNWVVIAFVINKLLGGKVFINFPFLNTILITLGSILILRQEKKTNPGK